MLAYLTALYFQIAEATKGNPILAGAVSLWGLGVVTVVCRRVPAKIWYFVVAQCTTSLRMNNTGYWGNRELFLAFLDWYDKTPDIKWTRTFSLDRASRGMGVVIGPGYGNHYLVYKRRLFKITKRSLESSGSEAQKEEVSLTLLGRNKELIEDLIEAFRPRDDESKLYAYRLNKDHEWVRIAALLKRPMESVIVPKEVKTSLVRQLDEFYSMREWYLSKGFNHKITTMIHGVPGCGKTSLIKALAGHYKADLYILNVNSISDSALEHVLNNVPGGSFLLLEDIDSASAVHSRDPQPRYVPPSVVPGRSTGLAEAGPSLVPSGALPSSSDFSMLSLTGILNALDGAIPLDNIAVFTTTNHLEKIDAALLRKGRTDHIIELKFLEDPEIKEFVRYAYGTHEHYVASDLDCRMYEPMPGCNLHSLVLTHKLDYQAFKQELDDLQKETENDEQVISIQGHNGAGLRAVGSPCLLQ